MKQTSFFKKSKLIHGGMTAKGNPREARPLSLRRPIHLVMRSSRAFGAKSFLRAQNAGRIERVVRHHAEACGVCIYDFANGGNHLHLIVRIRSAKLFRRFLRSIAGIIARLILCAEKGKRALKANQVFWDARPFTRIVDWGKSYEILKSYLTLNKLEALGFVRWRPRDHKKRRVFSIAVEPFMVGAI